MAEKLFTNVRLGLKIDTLENWGKSSLVLKKGEVAFATVAASEGLGLTDPVVMMKIGDGEHTFSELTFDFYAKASDVLSACKSEAALKAFINGVIADAGIATDEAMQELAGKVTTAEGKITTLEGKMTTVEGKAADNAAAILALQGLVGDQDVAARITAAINALDLANTYEAKGEAAKVSTALETYKTSNDAAVEKVSTDLAGEIARAKAAEEANAGAISKIKDGTTIDSFADVESALAGKQAVGDYATKAEAQGYANAKDTDIAAAKKAGEDAAAAVDGKLTAEVERATAAEAQALKDAKDYVDAEILEMVGDKSVATQIAELDLANTYDAKGAAATAESNAKAHATGLNTAMNARVEALEAIDHEHANKTVLDGITAEKVAAWDAAEANAKEYADDLDEVMDGRVAALEAKFGEGEGNVESQIEAAVAAEAALREAADTALSGRVKAIEDDYLVEADKTELAGKITALEGVVGDVESIADFVAGAVKAEEDRAKGIEADLEERLAAVEDDYLTSADKEGLQAQINTIMSNPDAEGAINSINEFTQYVKDHGTIAEGFRQDIDANAKAIEDEAKRAAGVEGGLDTRLQAVEAASATHASKDAVDALTTEVAKKALASDLTALDGRVGTVEGKVSTLEGEMDAVEGRADALEAKLDGVTTVVDYVAGEVSAAVAAEAEIARAAEKANADAIDALEAKAPTWDAAVQTVTAGVGLKAVKSGTDVAIDLDEAVTFIFDCGGADVE